MPIHPLTSTLTAALEAAAQRLAAARGGPQRPVCYLPGNAGRIDAVERWIFEHPQRLAGTDVFQLLALGPAAGWEAAVMAGVGVVTPFIGPGVRRLINHGLARNIRCNLSQVPRLFDKRWRPEVAFAHVSPPDAQGRVTLGLNAGIDIAPVQAARYKVALVNARMPRWHVAAYEDPATGQTVHSGCAMALSEFDAVVEIDEPLFEHSMDVQANSTDDDTARIARHIVELMRSEAGAGDSSELAQTIQLGIGRIPNAVADELVRKQLSVRGVWSEMFSDGVLRLYDAGLIRHGQGPALRERIVVGFVLGGQTLYDRMRENPDFAVLPQGIVNDPSFIRHNPGMVSINSAISVSLAGEVSAATIHKQYYSGVGGQFDFALGASWAQDGLALIGLPSAVRLGDSELRSKIVAAHPEGAHHTIGADLPVVVVTEQGVADLRQLNDPERVEAMLQIVHPQWRAELTKQARGLPSMQGVGAVPARLIRLRNGRHAVLRPAGKPDIGVIAEYILRMSHEDRYSRYMGTVSVGVLTSDKRLSQLYDKTLDYSEHAAFLVQLDADIVGVAHAFRIDDGPDYEISFSRRSDLVGQRIGRHLMHMLIDWAAAAQVQALHAVTYRTRNPRMRALFDSFGFVASANPDDPDTVKYFSSVEHLLKHRNASE